MLINLYENVEEGRGLAKVEILCTIDDILRLALVDCRVWMVMCMFLKFILTFYWGLSAYPIQFN